ncbi:hypothetical protein HK100_003178, partial [Physocladia obscura]
MTEYCVFGIIAGLTIKVAVISIVATCVRLAAVDNNTSVTRFTVPGLMTFFNLWCIIYT